MPSHHSSGHHSSSHHSSSTHHTSTTHHSSTPHIPPPMPVGSYYRRPGIFGYSGRPGGIGCGVIFAIIGVIVAVVVVGIVLVSNNVAQTTGSVGFDGDSNTVSNDPTSIPLPQDPTVIADLAVMNTSLDSHLADWESQHDTIVHHVSVADAGLPDNFNTKEVVYGYCSSTQFYMFVLNITPPDDTTADTEGYEFTPGGTPNSCAPAGWNIMSSDLAAADWYFITADTTVATQGAPTATPAE